MEDMDKLVSVLSSLTKRINSGAVTNNGYLKTIVSSLDINEPAWALKVLGEWVNLLNLAKNSSDDTVKDIVVKGLMKWGIPEFPAILACESVRPKPIAVEQQITIETTTVIRKQPLFLLCPVCKRSDKTLNWNDGAKIYECWNINCRAKGQSVEMLFSPFIKIP